MSRTRKERHLASARPRLRRLNGKWECSDGVVTTTAHSYQGAYEAWLTKAIADAMKSGAKPKKEGSVKPPASKPAPVEPCKVEITVVKGVQPRPSLKLPQALLINAERARAVQGPLRSLCGIREGA